MEENSSILAWKTPWAEEPGGLQSDMTKLFEHYCGLSPV